MPRRPRFVQPGIPYHITQRGNNRQDVFFHPADRVRYLQLFAEHSIRYDLRILAWCLMTNHVHLIAIPGDADSMAHAMGQAHSHYSLEQNRNHRWSGHLWQNRFSSCALDSGHLLAAMRYVELNPVRAGIARDPWEWPWSSAAAHVGSGAGDALLDWSWESWMVETSLGTWDFEDWKSVLGLDLPHEETTRIRRATELGEPLGSDLFVASLERQAGRRLRVLHPGRPVRR
jgi:putative transposase